MKIIHTADVHLDSPLISVADSAKRRLELLKALNKMSNYASNTGISAIIVAGDLFDEDAVLPQTVESVAQIVSASNAQWFVLRGNHSTASPYEQMKKLCPKICFFGDDWTSYNLGNVTICGRENNSAAFTLPSLDASRYNVLVLHGDIDDDAYGHIDKKVLANSCVKYVALGHRHTFCQHKFGKVTAVYSGVLEARGFDEQSGGFVVLDTEKDTCTFVPQHIRRVVTLPIDVSAVSTNIQLEQHILDSVSQVDSENYLNAVFVGAKAGGINLKMVAESALSGRFFALRIQDNTTPQWNLQQLKSEVSLRGEFVKLACQIQDETQRAEVLRLGLAAMEGGDLS